MVRKTLLSLSFIFIVLVIHCVCTVALYCKTSTSSEMEIKAQIIIPAQIEVIKHIDFGKLFAGTKNNKAFGQYRVRFDSDADVELTYAGIELDDEETAQIFLKNTENSKVLPVFLKINKSDKFKTNDNSERNEYLIDINGTLNVPNDTPRGIYKESIIATVKYN